MEFERAKEILNSKGVIDVNYRDEAVWIKNIHEADNTAEVTLLDHNRMNAVVSISDLEEGKE